MEDRSSLTQLTGVVWLDNVMCDGTEASLFDCNRNTLFDNNCVRFDQDDDAACACFGFLGDVGELSLQIIINLVVIVD